MFAALKLAACRFLLLMSVPVSFLAFILTEWAGTLTEVRGWLGSVTHQLHNP